MVQKSWTDEDLDIRMGQLLRAGVILSAAIMIAGAAVYLFGYGRAISDYRIFHPAALPVRSVTGILTLALHGDGRGLIQLAALLMIATPVARVIFAVYAFARQGDRLYVLISLTVLSLLFYGLIWGV